jgi:hypothetical protein
VKKIANSMTWKDGDQVVALTVVTLIAIVGFGLILFGGRA